MGRLRVQSLAGNVTEKVSGRWKFKVFQIPRLLMTVMVLSLLAASTYGDVIFTPLFSFTGTNGTCLGAAPYGGLVLGADGNYYGTTSEGGSNNLGTIYRITPDGQFTSLISFNGTNGASPYIGLVKGKDGNLYGTTTAGGVSNWGTIFSINTNSELTTLFSFTGTNYAYQGASPASTLVEMADGSFYGTANYGGTTNNAYNGRGYGTIFHLNADQTLSVPFIFGNTNGAHPSGGLILGSDGNFYGTATWGGEGVTATFPGYGTIFKMRPDGTFTNIYVFTGGDDGGFIYSGLIQGRDGYLYGGAFSGGTNRYGTLFKVSTNGIYTLLHVFTYTDNGSPYAALTEGTDGNFYGTTYGAYAGYGSVFEMTPDGVYTNLFHFDGSNGTHPAGVLTQGTDGDFYGTTLTGGTNDLGTIFKLSVPLTPVITALSRSNDLLSLTWTAVAGQTYQVEYSTELFPAVWYPVGNPMVATGGMLTATNFDSAASSTQRFYRIALQNSGGPLPLSR